MDAALVAALLAVAVGLAVPAILFMLFRDRIVRIMAVARSLESLEAEVRTLAREFGELSDRNIARLERGTEELEALLERVRTLGTTPSDERSWTAGGGMQEAGHGPIRPGAGDTEMSAREDETETRRIFLRMRPNSECRDTSGVDAGGTDDRREPIILDLGRGGSTDRPAPLRMRPVRTEALDLYRSGLSADAIAARLGLSIAEVELIVGLEERRGTPPRSRPRSV